MPFAAFLFIACLVFNDALAFLKKKYKSDSFKLALGNAALVANYVNQIHQAVSLSARNYSNPTIFITTHTWLSYWNVITKSPADKPANQANIGPPAILDLNRGCGFGKLCFGILSSLTLSRCLSVIQKPVFTNRTLLFVLCTSYFILGAVATPIVTGDRTQLSKRGYEIPDQNNPLKIILRQGDTITPVGKELSRGKGMSEPGAPSKTGLEDGFREIKKQIDAHQPKLTYSILPSASYTSIITDKRPALEVEPRVSADIFIWTPTIEAVLYKEVLDAKTEWGSRKEYILLKNLVSAAIANHRIAKIVTLGTGSMMPGPSRAFFEFGEKALSPETVPELKAKSVAQVALALLLQDEFEKSTKTKPELFFQDPAYSETEIKMLKEKFPKVDVVNDPDGFNLVDKNTLVFSIGGFEGFWYQMAMGTAVTKPVSPAVIVSDTFNWNSWKHLKKPDAAMPTKVSLYQEMIKQYTPTDVSDKEAKGFNIRQCQWWVRK